jgi:hypothetical protein
MKNTLERHDADMKENVSCHKYRPHGRLLQQRSHYARYSQPRRVRSRFAVYNEAGIKPGSGGKGERCRPDLKTTGIRFTAELFLLLTTLFITLRTFLELLIQLIQNIHRLISTMSFPSSNVEAVADGVRLMNIDEPHDHGVSASTSSEQIPASSAGLTEHAMLESMGTFAKEKALEDGDVSTGRQAGKRVVKMSQERKFTGRDVTERLVGYEEEMEVIGATKDEEKVIGVVTNTSVNAFALPGPRAETDFVSGLPLLATGSTMRLLMMKKWIWLLGRASKEMSRRLVIRG